ncbi:type VII secretion-associated protein [Pseudonocardia xinjiangensis]|uniref:Type VII secretion-associated protein n=1 Tax=Pseudonocardia xinjiangensis TaxID=75289 RepID=A0ABX1R6U0_9PSEU|nr:type VII secretion-associated protein [Pseudonocardia xinjiangensis]NMH76095.1 type VII secretion-associated protein [Pseudonocardia xinjiangensis]
MSGTPVRVAVQLGAATARVAAAGADGEPWLVARKPARGVTVASLLAEFAPGPEELVLVHPPGWPAPRTASWVGRCAGLACRVRAVPVPVAAAGCGDVAVLDVGHGAAEATRLDASGNVLAVRSRAVAGAALDAVLAELLGLSSDDPAAVAEARRVREALSLLPSVQAGAPEPVPVRASEVRPLLARQLAVAVEALREVLLEAGPAPVLLVGGVARTPLLAELVDEAGIAGAAGVAVAPRPDVAAVLGALVLPDAGGHPWSVRVPDAGRTPHRESTAAAPFAAPGSGPERSAALVARRLPPPPVRTRSLLRIVSSAAAAAVLVAGLLGAGVLLPSRPPAAVVPAGVLVQYGYRLDVPAGWEHTGGLPERRRTLLTPAGAPEGSDLIAVERSPLGYDTGAEPERARAELRAEFESAAAAGSALRDYTTTTLAGREVATYRQRGADGRTVVDWFVLLDGDAQLSVGCRHTAAGSSAVRAACDVVVASVRRA